MEKKYDNYKLCYVESSQYPGELITLYFTELADVTKQWGDDWNDRPYEHNAGTPYENDYSQPEQGVKNGVGIYPKIDICQIILSNTWNISTPRMGHENSPYSVEDINRGVVPWLTILHNNKATYIKAGTTLKEASKTIRTVNEDCKFFCLLKE